MLCLALGRWSLGSFGSWVVGRWSLGVGRWGLGRWGHLGRWGQTLFSVYSQWFVGVRPCFRSLLANLANLANENMLECFSRQKVQARSAVPFAVKLLPEF